MIEFNLQAIQNAVRHEFKEGMYEKDYMGELEALELNSKKLNLEKLSENELKALENLYILDVNGKITRSDFGTLGRLLIMALDLQFRPTNLVDTCSYPKDSKYKSVHDEWLSTREQFVHYSIKNATEGTYIDDIVFPWQRISAVGDVNESDTLLETVKNLNKAIVISMKDYVKATRKDLGYFELGGQEWEDLETDYFEYFIIDMMGISVDGYTVINKEDLEDDGDIKSNNEHDYDCQFCKDGGCPNCKPSLFM